jgi:hypothetical protein
VLNTTTNSEEKDRHSGKKYIKNRLILQLNKFLTHELVIVKTLHNSIHSGYRIWDYKHPKN